MFQCSSILASEQTKLSRAHLLAFYQDYGLKTEHLTFEGSSKLWTIIYFKLYPKTHAYAVKNGTRIVLSPKFKTSLRAAITAHRPFGIFDQLALLHEYAHTRQTIVNTMLENDLIRQMVLSKLDFEILPRYKDEFCPDLFALGKMAAYAPSDIITFYEERRSMFDDLNKLLENSNNHSLKSRVFKVLYTGDGEHLSEANKLQLLKVMSDITQKASQAEPDQILPVSLLQFFKQFLQG